MCVTKDSIFAMFRVACLILCLVGVSLQVSINEFAVPSSIKVGENAELQCHYHLAAGEAPSPLFYVKWWWTPLGADADARHCIYQRLLGKQPWLQHFTNIKIKDNDTLLLQDLLPKHSGTYECEVSANYDEARKHQDMIVYTAGTGPSMSISAVADEPDENMNDDVHVYCQANGVAPRPDLVITLNGKEIPDGSEELSELPEGLYDIAANATVGKAAALGAVIRCELYYNDTNVTHEAFYVDHTYEEIGAGAGAATAPAAAHEGSPAPMDSTTEAQGNGGSGVAWSLTWGLVAPGVLALLASPADLFM